MDTEIEPHGAANAFPVVREGEIGGDTMMTVDARELHAFLDNPKDFSSWIKDRITQFEFQRGADFEVFTKIGENPSGGRPSKEYSLTLNMAKEVAMVDRSEKGKQVRRYFIECERRAQAAPDDSVLLARALADPQQARALLLDQVERNAALQGQIAEMKPDIEAFERIGKADGSTCITDTAKMLQMRPKDLFAYLRQNGWIYRRPGGGSDLGYQAKVVAGLLEHKVTIVTRADGTEKEAVQVRVTPRGLARLAQLIQPALVEA